MEGIGSEEGDRGINRQHGPHQISATLCRRSHPTGGSTRCCRFSVVLRESLPQRDLPPQIVRWISGAAHTDGLAVAATKTRKDQLFAECARIVLVHNYDERRTPCRTAVPRSPRPRRSSCPLWLPNCPHSTHSFTHMPAHSLSETHDSPDRIGIGRHPYGLPMTGYELTSVLDGHDQGMVILEEHGELFFHSSTEPAPLVDLIEGACNAVRALRATRTARRPLIFPAPTRFVAVSICDAGRDVCDLRSVASNALGHLQSGSTRTTQLTALVRYLDLQIEQVARRVDGGVRTAWRRRSLPTIVSPA